jgi:protease I
MTKRVALIVAFKNFRDEEYAVPKELFQQSGVGVTTVSSRPGQASGKTGLLADIDLTIDQLPVKDYDAVLFIGGGGCAEYFASADAHRAAAAAVSLGKVLGAICAAPEILARAGVLKGKKATMHYDNGSLAEGGAVFTDQDVVSDGRIVTGRDVNAARDWAAAVLKMLDG